MITGALVFVAVRFRAEFPAAMVEVVLAGVLVIFSLPPTLGGRARRTLAPGRPLTWRLAVVRLLGVVLITVCLVILAVVGQTTLG